MPTVRSKARWLLPLLVLAALPVIELLLRATGSGYPLDAFIKEGAFVRDNPYFGLICFPRQLARHAPHFRLPENDDSFRAVVLGESAAMGDPAAAFGLARQLDVLLSAQITNRPVEVVNAAMTAINSHIIRRIAIDLPRLHPDAVVIYMGNNEVIGPFGPGTVFGRPAPAPWIRAQLAARATRLGQFLTRRLDRAFGRESSAHRWQGLALFEERKLAADDPALRGVYRNFDANLRDIVRLAHEAGAKVILCTVAANDRMAPFASAPESDPARHAETQWHRARELERGGQTNEALDVYRLARDLDMLRVRADSRINGIIRSAVGAGVTPPRSFPFVDAESALSNDPANFLDHVHLTFHGNYQLARLVAAAIAPTTNAPPSEQYVARQLAYTPWSEARILQQMESRMVHRPYIDQADHLERMEAMKAQLRALQPFLANKQLHIDALTTALAARPHDAEIQLQWGLVLEEMDRPQEAAAVYGEMLKTIPHHTLAHLSLGRAQATMGQLLPAMDHFIQGSPLAANPRAEALATIGATLAELGRFREAEPYLRDALATDSRHLIALYNLGLLYGRTGRTNESISAYFQLLAVDPAFSEARNNAAALLFRTGRGEEALEHLRRVTREDPGYTAAWRNLAAVANDLGLTNEAAEARAHVSAE